MSDIIVERRNSQMSWFTIVFILFIVGLVGTGVGIAVKERKRIIAYVWSPFPSPSPTPAVMIGVSPTPTPAAETSDSDKEQEEEEAPVPTPEEEETPFPVEPAPIPQEVASPTPAPAVTPTPAPVAGKIDQVVAANNTASEEARAALERRNQSLIPTLSAPPSEVSPSATPAVAVVRATVTPPPDPIALATPAPPDPTAGLLDEIGEWNRRIAAYETTLKLPSSLGKEGTIPSSSASELRRLAKQKEDLVAAYEDRLGIRTAKK